MTDFTLVRRSLANIESYLQGLEVCKKVTQADFVNDMFIYHTAERLLELVIQSCLDIAMHIVSEGKLREPSSYADVFRSLQEGDIISDELATRLGKMARFRNLLVHVYVKVDVDEVYRIVHSVLGDINDYTRAILKYIGEQCMFE